MFLGLLVATAWFTVFGFLASWWLEHSDRSRMA
jgi:predicted outer membrane lipoprotein